ncbi:uncharacterized protein LOC144554202 isoform X3 [Carex rostrata]
MMTWAWFLHQETRVSVGFATKKSRRARRSWSRLVHALDPLSLRTGGVYKDGVMKREALFARFAFRGSLDVPRQNYEDIGVTNLEYVDCSPAPSRSAASSCRSLLITLATLLLLRHFMDVILIIEDDQYASNLLIMFSLRATGILLPFYFVLRLISTIQHGQRQYKLEQIQLRRGEEIERVTSDEENPSHYTIQIFS